MGYNNYRGEVGWAEEQENKIKKDSYVSVKRQDIVYMIKTLIMVYAKNASIMT